MNVFKIKAVEINRGKPKVIIPIFGSTETEIINEINILPKNNFDLVEWRVDYYAALGDISRLKNIAAKLAQCLPTTPLIFTCRSKSEGGMQAFSDDFYFSLNKEILCTGNIDLIDIEITKSNEIVRTLIHHAHAKHVLVIASYHDYVKTPDKSELISHLLHMQQCKADVLKLAVMATCHQDLLTLQSVAKERITLGITRPMILIAMGTFGTYSRIACNRFGSSLTFASGDHQSAPGQLPAHVIYPLVSLLHQD